VFIRFRNVEVGLKEVKKMGEKVSPVIEEYLKEVKKLDCRSEGLSK